MFQNIERYSNSLIAVALAAIVGVLMHFIPASLAPYPGALDLWQGSPVFIGWATIAMLVFLALVEAVKAWRRKSPATS